MPRKRARPAKLRIRPLDLDNPADRARLEACVEEWNKKLKPMIDAIRESQRLTAADYAIIINV